MNKPKGTLLIIDGNALIHRSFHALPPTLITKAGELVNAVYGFSAALIKAVKEFKPDYVVLTMDKKGPTFRHEEYKEYKATRVKAPDELYAQFDRVKEVAAAFGIPLYELSGFEADDLIGTICKQVNSGLNKIVLTGDMDTLQLVDDHTKVYAMSRGISDGVLYDEPAVIARYGLKPDQVVDYKALRGDPSDNIPGVKGIGEKTAVELLKEFVSLKGIYENLESPDIKERIKELLRKQQAEAELSYRLATIHQEAPIEFDLAGASFGEFDRAKVVELFSELAFKSLLARVQDLGKKGASSQIEGAPGVDKFERNKQSFKYYLVQNDKEFKGFLKKLKEQKAFVFDTETSSLDPLTCQLLGISFSWKSEEAYYVKVQSAATDRKNNDLFSYNQKDADNSWLEQLRSTFEDEKIKKYGHNAKFDLKVLSAQGVDVQGIVFDTMIASYLLNPGSRQHNLDGLAFSELGFEKISKDDLLGTGKNRLAFDQVPFERLAIYSCEDADITWRLVKKLEPELKDHDLSKLFKTLEMPLVQVLARMEELGISLDKNYLNKLGHKLHAKIEALEKAIYEQAGLEFNINSPSQLRDVLFEKLGLSTLGVGKTKTGLSTAADELEKLKEQHEIVRFILEYRELAKLTSTYIDALPKLINPKTKRIHTCYNQTVAATGRLSSSEPNLQNIPVRGDWGQAVRKAFVAAPGCKLVGLDYSQIELRLAAHYSGDERMIKAFRENEDIHTATAAAINEVEVADVTKEMRREAKATNFGIIYGQGPHGLSQAADIPFWRAKQFIDNYFEVYPGVKEWMDKAIEDSRSAGFAETLFGRKRNLPEINSSIMQVRKAAERMAINTPLQGTAADMIKAAMIEIHQLIEQKYQQGEVKMLLQVHDELLFEIKRDMVERAVPELKKIMESVLQLKVPVIVESKMGESWGELE